MSHAKLQLKELIREGVRTTIHNTLRDPAFKDPLMEVIRRELQCAIEELRPNGRPRSPRRT